MPRTKPSDRETNPINGRFKKSKVEDATPSPAFTRELEQGVAYAMTEPLALVYAKLLSVGCPPVRAVIYCNPELLVTQEGRDAAKRVAAQWMSDALVIAAISSINGGKWHELPMETRFRLAIEKSNAEASFYLWANNFVETEHREGLEKIKLARDIIKKELGEQPDEADPMAAFARFALELSKNMHTEAVAKGKKSPQQQKSGLDAILEAPLSDLEM